MSKPYSISELPESPDSERHRRMVRYSISMGIRVVCIIVCFFTPGWWILIPAAGAVILPWVAVIAANEKSHRGGSVERPGAIVRAHTPGEPW